METKYTKAAVFWLTKTILISNKQLFLFLNNENANNTLSLKLI